eukprot:511775-Amphidinium_carterae.1
MALKFLFKMSCWFHAQFLCSWMRSSTVNIFSAAYVVPWLETFWYVASMKLLEDTANGGAVLCSVGLKKKAQ